MGERGGGGTGAAVQGTAHPPNAKAEPGSPGRPPGSRVHQPLQTRGLRAPGRGHLSPRPPRRLPQPPGPHSGPFLLTRDAHSRHFPGARVTMPWCVFWSLLESGQAGDIRKKSAQTAPAPRARRLCFFRASVCPHPLISSGYDKALFLKSYFGLAGDLPPAVTTCLSDPRLQGSGRKAQAQTPPWKPLTPSPPHPRGPTSSGGGAKPNSRFPCPEPDPGPEPPSADTLPAPRDQQQAVRPGLRRRPWPRSPQGPPRRGGQPRPGQSDCKGCRVQVGKACPGRVRHRPLS